MPRALNARPLDVPVRLGIEWAIMNISGRSNIDNVSPACIAQRNHPRGFLAPSARVGRNREVSGNLNVGVNCPGFRNLDFTRVRSDFHPVHAEVH